MKRVFLYLFFLGYLTSCSHLCLVPAIKNQDYKRGYFNTTDTCLENEYYSMVGGYDCFASIIKGVEAEYEVWFKIGVLAPIDSIQLMSVCLVDETSQDTILLKKKYHYSNYDFTTWGRSDSIQYMPYTVKLDLRDTSMKKDVFFKFYPNLTKKQKKHTFSISYHLKVNEEDIIINDRKLIFIRLTPAIRQWYYIFLWPLYLIC